MALTRSGTFSTRFFRPRRLALALGAGLFFASLLPSLIAGEPLPADQPSPAQPAAAPAADSAAAAPAPKPRPRKGPGADYQLASRHWTYQSPAAHALPEVRDASRIRDPLDRFLQRRLENHGLTLSEPASRQALIRRLWFIARGLPPTDADIAAFIADQSPDAWVRLIDRALSGPAFGARWGKFWLDAAGYADSNGYFDADSPRPHAYRYRDWVIQAINDDMPYDQFLQWQLAGDELAGYTAGTEYKPAMLPMLTAAHFLRNGPDGTGESDGNPLERQTDRLRVLEGNLHNIGAAMLGLTLQCARCHDHPFDAVTQVEYYRLQALLTGPYQDDPKRWVKPNDRMVKLATNNEIERHRDARKVVDDKIAVIEKELDALRRSLTASLIAAQIAKLPEADRPAVQAAIDVKEKARTPEHKTLIKKHKINIGWKDDELAKEDRPFADRKAAADARIAELKKTYPPDLPVLAALYNTHEDRRPHLLRIRGGYDAPGPAVAPGVPASLTGPSYPFEPPARENAAAGHRTAFARWITRPDHPLTSRVIVNRLWRHVFGRGLVETVENLGPSGDAAHSDALERQLLDHLSRRFVADDWSIKRLLRTILASGAFMQSSQAHSRGLELDAANHLLWRFTLRRLEAEALRDAMLAAAGELDERLGGPAISTRRDGAGQVIADENSAGARRRSVYLLNRRTQLATFLELFDAPPIMFNNCRRLESTVPLQTLAVLNSDFIRRRAAALADRVAHETPTPEVPAPQPPNPSRAEPPAPDHRLERLVNLAFTRPARPDELRAMAAFLQTQTAIYAAEKPPEKPADKKAEKSPPPADPARRAWIDLCQALLASNEFLYAE